MTRWAVITGEYPPQSGGVADYTRLIADGLTSAGDQVSVFAPACAKRGVPDSDTRVHRLPGHFGPRGILALDRLLQGCCRPDQILVQYVPHAFGWKAMNLPFVAWVARRATKIAPVWVVFHEVMYPIEKGQSLKHAFLARVNRLMAGMLAGCATRIFVTIPAWNSWLKAIRKDARPGEWLPVPSNIPDVVAPGLIARLRSQVALPAGNLVLGHFGTFGAQNAGLIGRPIAKILRRSDQRVCLFIGRNARRFEQQFVVEFPELASRVRATGDLPAEEIAVHLAACDVLVQPYPDGITSRRTSTMAGLALGVPTVTNRGPLTEPVWESEDNGVMVAASSRAEDLVAATEAMLALSPVERGLRGQMGAAWYQTRFDLRHTISLLRASGASRMNTP